jgi:hypothetical protein
MAYTKTDMGNKGQTRANEDIHTNICRTLIEFAAFRPLPFPLSSPSEVSFPLPLPPLVSFLGPIETDDMESTKNVIRTGRDLK